MTTPERLRTAISDAGYVVAEERDLAACTQFKLTNKATINVFATGTVQFQGPPEIKDQVKERVSAFLDADDTSTPAGPISKKVFVVYGHDSNAKTTVEAMLGRWGLEPVMLDQIPAEGLTLIEKLEKYTAQARFAVVIACAEDVCLVSPDSDEREFRARQNVVLELGLLLRHLGRERVAILYQNIPGMKKPSDIDGLEYIGFEEDIRKEAGLKLAQMMANLGYPMDITKVN